LITINEHVVDLIKGRKLKQAQKILEKMERLLEVPLPV
jgi:ribosomal protein L22